MLWLIIVIFSYFLFALVALGDKYLLSGPPNPKSYSFYVGILGGLSFVLIPFVGFIIPKSEQVFLALLAGLIYTIALFAFYTGLEKFEASRIVPAIGGFLPLFTFALVFLFSGGDDGLSSKEILSFVLLLSGSVLISLEKKREKGRVFEKTRLGSIWLSILTALLFAIAFVLAKYVYLKQPFWSGFILMRMGGFFTALCFIFSKTVRNEIFQRKFTLGKRKMILFVLNQGTGAGAFILQNWAIALAGLSYLAIINALQGTEYVFLLIFTFIISLRFPQILKEKFSTKIIIQKVIATLIIGAGLVLFALK